MNTTKHPDPDKFRPFRPSAAKRWLKCHKSEATLIKDKDRRPDNEYNTEGRLAHDVAAAYLKGAKVPEGATDDMHYYAREYYGFIAHTLGQDFRPLSRKNLMVEEHFKTKYFEGSPDAAAFQNDILWIFDYKYGEGVYVSSENNVQMIIYALAVITKLKLKPREVRLAIFQPRREDFPTEVVTYDMVTMQWWASLLKETIDKIKSGRGLKYKSGEHCQFCPMMARCPELKEETMELMKLSAGDKALTVKQLADVLEAAPQIRQFLRAVEEQGQEILRRGGEVPGFKLVESLGNREWKDEKQALKKLAKFGKTKIMSKPELLSPAQVERITGRGVVDPLTKRESRGTRIAPESDRRAATSPAKLAAKDFA